MEKREFTFTDGKSDKFWTITLEGASHTVQFGRTGTAGQTQTKEFASEDEARKSYDKLIQEKVKKGYVESGAAPSPTPPIPIPKPAPKPKAVPAAPEPALAPQPAPVIPSPPHPLLPSPRYTRTLALHPADWFRATWRKPDPLPRPEPPAFDVQEAIRRLLRVKSEGRWGFQWNWELAALAPALTPEEARFWHAAMCRVDYDHAPKEVALKLAGQNWGSRLSLEDATKKIETSRQSGQPEVMICLASLFPLEGILNWIFEAEERRRQQQAGHRHVYWTNLDAMVQGFRRYVLPYLSPAEHAAAWEQVAGHLSQNPWPAAVNDLPPVACFLAAALGFHDEMRVIAESWPDDHYGVHDYGDHAQHPQDILFGLGDPAEMQRHFQRLKLPLRNGEHLRAWLAHTEFGALETARDTIIRVDSKEAAESMLPVFGCAQAPEAAPLMLDLMLNSRAPRLAREWLDAHPDLAAPGLIPTAAGRGRLAEAAGEYLRTLKRNGGEALIRAALEQQPGPEADRVRQSILEAAEDAIPIFTPETTPEWLREPLQAVKKSNLTWVRPADLPALLAGSGRLSEEQVALALAALQKSTLETPHPLVPALRGNADRRSLDQFAWRLFERWLSEGAPSKDRWAMSALGLVGGDTAALKLAPLVRLWPGESQHQRAVHGLECLRGIGTDTALMQINGIAEKVKFKGLKQKALECMEAIANERGMSRAELEDRIVPDCGLDERGSRVLDFGPRQFRLVLGAGMKPVVRDPEGKLKPDLPKPTAKDDPALAADAVAEWKLLKKQVAEVAKIQSARLEQAMVTGRKWTPEEFELLLVRHPLMTNLVRLLVWGTFTGGGELAAAFRVTEDLTYADASDEEFPLDPAVKVGIVHPLLLSGADRQSWGEILSDYEIVPPFPQLGRPLHFLQADEEGGTEIHRYPRVKIPAPALVGTLERQGWQRGIPEDGGVYFSHSKPFYGAEVTAMVEYEDGVPAGYMDGWDDQEITRCYFISGIWRPEMYYRFDERKLLPLHTIHPVVLSEVLSDLALVASKSR